MNTLKEDLFDKVSELEKKRDRLWYEVSIAAENEDMLDLRLLHDAIYLINIQIEAIRELRFGES